MKKTLLLIAAFVGLGLPAWAYDFSAVAPFGQTLYYNIVDASSVTVVPPESFAFNKCTGLSSIILSNNLTSIGSYAFDECVNLQHIEIPNITVADTVPTYDTLYLTVRDTVTVTDTIHDTITVTETVHDTVTITNTVHDTVRVEAAMYTLSVVSSNAAMGIGIGNGSFAEGTEVEIGALPLEGHLFTGWNDGNGDNPRRVTVSENCFYIASFAEDNSAVVTAIAPAWSASAAQGGVVVRGEQLQGVQLFDEYGRLLATHSTAAADVRFEVLASGVYFVRVGGSAARRVVVVK